MTNDDAQDALFFPFGNELDEGMLQSARILYINVSVSPNLKGLKPQNTDCVQWSYMDANDVENSGYKVFENFNFIADKYDLVLINGVKQQDHMRYLIASALDYIKRDGVIVCAAPNDAGGKRLKKDFIALGLTPSETSKFKCRIVYANVIGDIDSDKKEEWQLFGKFRKIDEIGFVSVPGIFSWDRIDIGSSILLYNLPEVIKGDIADFGCGYGYLSHSLLSNYKSIDSITCIDSDARAFKACSDNIAAFEGDADINCIWDDATNITKLAENHKGFDHIIMNPPFHKDKNTSYDLGQGFIKSASKHLKKHGNLWMVANSHLPYERVLCQYYASVEMIAQNKGFKIINAKFK